MLKKYHAFKKRQLNVHMNVGNYLNVVTFAKIFAPKVVTIQENLAKNRSIKNYRADIQSKLTASNYLKKLNATVIAHFFYPVDTNVQESVKIANR